VGRTDLSEDRDQCRGSVQARLCNADITGRTDLSEDRDQCRGRYRPGSVMLTLQAGLT